VITQTRQIYKCEYCRKLYQIKNACARHENVCKKNPLNYQPCLDDCKHITTKEFVYCFDTYQGSSEREVKVLYCKKRQVAVCPFWHNPYDFIVDENDNEVENDFMPKKCENFRKEVV